jgi:hypothetical protein
MPRDDRHMRQDIEKVDESRLKAMLETSAEMLDGFVKAFGDYERKNEAVGDRRCYQVRRTPAVKAWLSEPEPSSPS